MRLSDFDYALPPELIAQQPLAERSASRLLVVDGNDAPIEDRNIADLAELLQPGDLLVMNDTRVLHARLYGIKDSGGRIEVLVERITGEHEALAQIRASKPPKPGCVLHLEGALEAKVLARAGEFYHLRFPDTENVIDLLERHGRLPLPPYIERNAADADEARYQTVFARTHGSVAAPTAGLHFDDALLAAVEKRGCRIAYVTLHVGAGTFQPVRSENLAEHRMHRERYILPEATAQAIAETRRKGGRIVAVGTTTLRTLESAAIAGNGQLQAGAGETGLFILPGFRFRIVDALLTNFHLPKSTLLMLVSAFAGIERIRTAYAHAIAQGYRFFSYGDAMLLTRTNDESAP
ncbi:tRNA preQ1(34) S-adenosylmethionine ribosyltransferase-isomerase QueA [Sterolibacterium denitrificans]|uniref:tRNA preQ1(34) S-adenosylmethionine ribosyltransferase-isomerase QueA n=1 Tax=Sterolibacterium denitrificans TaxID=157592 RepID=UPI001E393C2B|nr:tRNA preQ1(34) S-adenosylmethionine ribosyltransferase-isomerase QueA [Sterolibacterium denitrificans]